MQTETLSKSVRLLSHAFGPAGPAISPPITLFAEQAISVLRLLVDRAHPGDSSHPVPIEIGDFIFPLGRYIYRLGRDTEILRMKASFCNLCERILLKSDGVTFSNRATFCNAALAWISEWLSESTHVSQASQPQRYYIVDIDEPVGSKWSLSKSYNRR